MNVYGLPGNESMIAAQRDGEPVFVFIRDEESARRDPNVIQVASLPWVLEQYADMLSGDWDTGNAYMEAYILLPGGSRGLQRCNLGSIPGKRPGDNRLLRVSGEQGTIALYEIG